MKRRFWASDWFAGLVVALVFLVFYSSPLLQGVERWAYDLGVRATAGTPSDKVAVIAIDDESIENIGRWPWSRDIHAALLDLLHEGGAKVVGHTVFFLEPQIDPGLAYISELRQFFFSSSLYQEAPADLDLLGTRLSDLAAADKAGEEVRALQEFYAQSSLSGKLTTEIATLAGGLEQAEQALNTDRQLARSMAQAANVVLAAYLQRGEPRGNPDQELPDYVRENAVTQVDDRIGAVDQNLFPLTTVSVLPPIPALGEAANAIGHLTQEPDVDGAIRSEPLVLLYYDAYIPSLALQVAAKSLNLDSDDIQVHLGEGVRLGNLEIGTDPYLQMQTFFYSEQDGKPAFAVDSFYDVITGKIPPTKYKDKIVLVGATAVGIGDTQITPVGAVPPVVTLAHFVSSILNEDFFVIPEWAGYAKLGLFALIALYLMLLLPRLKAGLAAVITAVLLIGIIIAHFVLMTSQAMWVQMMVPATLLLVGHVVLTTKRFLVTESGKLKSEAESAESNRMLGLAYQGQGQLDAAFDKYRKCPLDESVMDLLYNLALDFERKRQFNKAGSVYQYMSTYDPKFRDVEQRMARTKAMEETVILGGGGGGSTAAGTLIIEGDGVQKPMLGRYQVEKELGKGAMGVVYLGKDPKINRVVAIKTMALSQEFEPDELEDVKNRFFREAETAGRLTHPNIVTIYDAGEEHDLAYIAMEFLKGGDLVPFTKKDKLLPIAKVVEIVANAADALSYAHAQNVVHRDIKPANIMYEAESNSMKITDFGIARITDSSRTKTGMVLGTPSYMSPEQLAGKKVDGRSDLFSLGVMLYQMATGALPFQGDSMATLMYKIANEQHPDIREIREEVPECLKAIIDRALEKDVEKRYQQGSELARDLRECAATLAGAAGTGT